MKPILSALIAIASILSPAVAADDGHGHDKVVPGPNGGRVIEVEGGHAEFFVQPDKKARVTILDEEKKAVAPAEQKVTLVAEAPAGKTKLDFKVVDGAFVSDAALPEGNGYRLVLQIRANPEAKPQNTRIDYNMSICAECKHPEYACTCAAGGDAHGH